MRIWGKLIGGVFGLMLAGPMGLGLFGLVIGIWVGSQFDAGVDKLYRRFEREQARSYRARSSSYSYSMPKPPQPLDAAYAVLGVATTASDVEIKKAYRRLMSQHHPDKLIAKGLPESMLKIATQKTQEIKAAYEKIKASRGIR